jgi:iron complex transport system substrate-binding protein
MKMRGAFLRGIWVRWNEFHRGSLGLLILLLFVLGGCSDIGVKSGVPTPNPTPPNQGSKSSQPTTTFPLTVTDARGQSLTLNAPPQRIVSLAPSNTELLFALGLGEKIVGVTTACDYPPEAKQKPNIGGAYNMSVESILSKNPDLVVAYGTVNQKPLQQLEHAKIPVLAIDAKTVAETYDAIRLLGRATGTNDRAEEIIEEMQSRISAVEKAVNDVKTKPRVLIAYSVGPIYTTGPSSFIADIVRVAGGVNVVSEKLPQDIVTPERGVALAPDVILCAPELRDKLKQIPGWSSLPAIRNNRFFSVSSEATLVRAAPRLAKAAEELARYLHPDRFPPETKQP